MISDTEQDDVQELQRRSQKRAVLSKKKVTIVVLGDIGRSPRMNYHALSLAKEGYFVHMIGYGGSPLKSSVANNPSIWVQYMTEPPTFLQKIPRILSYPLKVAWQMIFLTIAFLWMILRYQFYPEFILLQNPPAIPTLTLCYLFSKVVFADFIIDWHNYGYSLMGISIGVKNPIVKYCKLIEDFFGARADKHLCVTKAMKQDLKERLGINAVTLYDRPPEEIFKSLSEKDKKAFLLKLSNQYPSLTRVIIDEKNSLKDGTRPGILISSTSWTEDEDFRILLSALEEYESASRDEPQFYPKLIVFITGKGPQKEYYKQLIESINFKNVEINLPWLEHADYPKLLACADLGISLHYSSSGLDLPMKVVDMFGCGLPVCAINFNCLSELVKNGENGFIFNTSNELANQIQAWFKISSKSNPNHKKFRENLKTFQSLRWHENWKHNALPLFKYK